MNGSRLSSALVLLAAMHAPAWTQIIERMPVFQPVSLAYARATAPYRGQSVEWKVVCVTVDEVTGVTAIAGDTLRSVGDSVQLRLLKDTGKYTYYKIFASAGTTQDSIQLQVFGKASMQKYLYTSPAYPTRAIPVHLYLPSTFSTASSKLLLSMHGVDRNAYSYGLTWTSYAAANNTVVVAPEFNAIDWPGDAYSQGNVFTANDGTGSLNPPQKWTFTIVQEIERTIARGFGLRDSSYVLWGHSAGGQFVHRMTLFLDDTLRFAIAANSGWYTAPDTATIFPWGVKHPFLWFTGQHLVDYTTRSLVIMRGTADTIRDSNLNTDSLSDLQGLNRFQRAGYFYQMGVSVNPSLAWQIREVQDVGHDYQKMALAAGQFLTSLTDVTDERDDNIPREFELLQNYPNPFNPTTVVSYHIPVISNQSSVVSVKVYDLLGREVAVLVDGVKPAGWHSVTWNAAHVPSGIYLCWLTAGQHSAVIKMVLVK